MDLDDQIAEMKPELKQAHLDYHALLNRVFSTDDGKKLLDRWVEDHVYEPVVIPGQVLEVHGMRQGRVNFILDIKKAMDLIENNYYQKEDNSNG